MKSLLIIAIALFSVAFAHTRLRYEDEARHIDHALLTGLLGHQHRDFFPVCPPFCPAGSKCRGGICVQNSKLDRKRHRDFSCPPHCPPGTHCRSGECVRDWSYDFFYKPPCPVACPIPGQICVRGVCQ